MNLELEIFRNLFVSIAEEMGIVLRRTSFSPNTKERRDYSCAVYDHQAETIAMGDHMARSPRCDAPVRDRDVALADS